MEKLVRSRLRAPVLARGRGFGRALAHASARGARGRGIGGLAAAGRDGRGASGVLARLASVPVRRRICCGWRARTRGRLLPVRGIREACRTPPILLSSGYTAGKAVTELLSQTRLEILRKPRDPDQVLLSIEAALGRGPS